MPEASEPSFLPLQHFVSLEAHVYLGDSLLSGSLTRPEGPGQWGLYPGQRPASSGTTE